MADTKTAALIGSESLLGREIRDIVAQSSTGISLRLMAASEEEGAGRLTRQGDEPTIVNPVSAEQLVGADVVLLADTAESNRKALELAEADPDVVVVDLGFTAEERPDAVLRAPSVEGEDGRDIDSAVHIIAHPAAIAIAIFLRRLQSAEPVRKSLVHIFAPASEHGQPGVEELQQQTISLLSFKSLPKKVFDAQTAFNMLARYGEEAPTKLEETEQRIERHLATLLDLPGEGEGAPMPSLRLIQAPVFHGYSFSIWVEFEANPGNEALESLLQSDQIDVHGNDVEPPTNLGQAGEDGIAVGAIEPDRNNPEAAWFWMVVDNLRLQAINAVKVVMQLP